MIVQCPDCASRFRLADDKLKPEGTKVRCSRCQKVFMAMPSPDSLSMDDADSVVRHEPAGQGGPGFHELDFGDTPSEAELSGESEEDNESVGGSEFDFGAFDSEQECGSEDFFSDSAEGTEDFAFGDPVSFEDGSEFSMGEDSDDFFASSEETPVETQSIGESSDPSDILSQELPADDSFATQGPLSEEMDGFGEDLFGSVDFDDKDLGLPSRPASISSPRKSGRKGVVILVLLFLSALVGGGYFAWTTGRVDLAGITNISRIRTFLHLDAADVAEGQIRTAGLNGFFLQSRKAGRLFVIQGKAVNDYREPRSAIAVKGVIFDVKGEPLLQQTVFCGNPLDSETLQSASFERIVERMNNQFGDSLSNLNVPAGKSIPFTIVFRNLPAELSEFSVEVVDSKSASR